MKQSTFLLLATFMLLYHSAPAQHLEVEGKTKLTNMETVTSAAENVVRKADGTLAVMTINQTYSVGDFAKGGVVFWVNSTGQHGKVVNIYNIGATPWSNIFGTLISLPAQSQINGAGNTVAIILQNGHERSAAKHCADLAYNGYDDWYLPALDELALIYTNRSTINTTATTNGGESLSTNTYWSSTEHNNANALLIPFGTGIPSFTAKINNHTVRAIRAF